MGEACAAARRLEGLKGRDCRARGFVYAFASLFFTRFSASVLLACLLVPCARRGGDDWPALERKFQTLLAGTTFLVLTLLGHNLGVVERGCGFCKDSGLL